jgi:hypothetical protein
MRLEMINGYQMYQNIDLKTIQKTRSEILCTGKKNILWTAIKTKSEILWTYVPEIQKTRSELLWTYVQNILFLDLEDTAIKTHFGVKNQIKN